MIPQVFHTIWVQGDLPVEYDAWFASWKHYNPDWAHILWAESDYLGFLENREIYDTAVNHAQRAEIASKEILLKYGGVYVDADFECLQPLGDLLDGVDCFTAEESVGQIAAGIVGCIPGHPAMRLVVDDIERSILWQRRQGKTQNYGAGPHILERLWRPRSDVTKFKWKWFYPYRWDQSPPEKYRPETYAVHHWKATWK